MKLSTLLFTFIVFIQSGQASTQVETSSSFQFTIYGNAKNADGVKLALYIPSRGLDNRITSEVVNGKYVFKGSAEFIEKAEIRFEENIVNPSNIIPYHIILIEPDSINVDIEIGGDPMLRRFVNFQLLAGLNNIYYYEVDT